MTITYLSGSGTSFRTAALITPATVPAIEVERGRLIDLNVFKQRTTTTGIHAFIPASVIFAVEIYSQDCKRKCEA
jgi:hypothetical protein